MYNISVVSQETGIKSTTLRKWEDRYGYPSPVRSPNGERVYSAVDIDTLRQVKHFIDLGVRPSKIFSDLSSFLSTEGNFSADKVSDPRLKEICDFILSDRIDDCFERLQYYHFSLSIRQFVEEICAPLCEFVGDAWESRKISIHTEHIVSEQLLSLLSTANPPARKNQKGTVVLATFANELHTIGLKMADVSFIDAGYKTIYLGASLPLTEIMGCCEKYRPDILGISIASHGSSNTTTKLVMDLRAKLSSKIKLWLGGSGCGQLKKLPLNAQVFSSTSEIYSHH
ncbi:MAG: MerR family transcriptional regulator [Motiliproteus sp.]|nr:MerR family transcriptional regulator [Motiliproteus sp.]